MRAPLSLLLVVAAVMGLPATANGATLFSNLDGGYGGAGPEATQTTWVAQPFVPTSSGLARVASFWAVSYFPQTTSTSVSIYENSTANGGQPGNLLAAGTPVTIDSDTESTPWCTPLGLQFGEPLSLSAGQTYWAVMRTHGGSVAPPNNALWLHSTQGGGAPKVSTNSGGTWGAGPGAAFTIRIDDTPTCSPDITPNPNPGVELGDMYAKPTGTGFQTLFVSNNGVAPLNLTGGSFSGPNASMFKVFKGEPGGPEGSNFVFPKTLGSGTGGVFLYMVCAPPAGTPDGVKTATFSLSSNDPDESPISWPVWCLVDSTPPSLEFIVNPDGRSGWFKTRPAPINVRGIDPESGNRVKRIFCTDNGQAKSSLDWKNGSFASLGIEPDGFHTISCQGTDAANNTSAPGGYSTSLKVDGTPPETTTTDGPPAVSEQTAFSFSFTGSDALSGLAEFECSLDGEPFQMCASPVSRSGLRNGTHTFDVRARDVAGSYDPTPARWTWQVARPAPIAGDDELATGANAPLDIDVLANDVEPRGEPLTIVLVGATTEKGGAVSLVGTRVRYVPPAGFVGTDRFSYRAVNGTDVESAAATVTVQVAAPPSIPRQPSFPIATPAAASSLAFSPGTFRAATRGASVAAKKKPARPPVGSTVRYRLNKPSRVTFTVEQAAAGKLRGRSCVKPTKALRKARSCTRYVARTGSFAHNGKAGANSFKFSGRLANKALGPGAYRLIATPAAAGARRATAVRASFKISR